ncbi:MAG TPA: TetR/AcrR family transcriptional regulator, partial [Acidimicrobiales bacterium]|nr:TetR/AcrR family transcriptional regulator [Acidimicrobiales bacterium]
MAPRPPDVARRRQLLDAVIRTAGERGIGDRSLREVADAAGTSHRVLLHHFGSREGLLLAIVKEVERRQAAVLETLPPDAADAVAGMWADVRRPELRPFERLFFECYARGAQGEAPFDQMVPAAVDDWLADVARVSGGRADPALARLALAVVRGLLLDLVGTNDAKGVDAAM